MPRDYVKSRSRQPQRSGPPGVVWLLLGVFIGLIIAGVFYVKNQRQHPQVLTVPALPLPQKAAAPPLTAQQKLSPANTKNPSITKSPSTQNLQAQFDFYNVLPSKQVIGPSGEEDTTEIQNQNAAHAAAENMQAQQNPKNPPDISTPVLPASPTAIAEPQSAPEKPKAAESKTKILSPSGSKNLAPVVQAVPAPKPKTLLTPLPASPVKPSDFVVQIAALSNAGDADQLKAQLSLLGFNVNVTPTQKGGKTYHRVWLGPFHHKAEAQSAHKQLEENMISSQVLKSGT